MSDAASELQANDTTVISSERDYFRWLAGPDLESAYGDEPGIFPLA